jgi:ribosome biogenesis GTPase / thiamine phosphate phosphatase
VADGLDVGRVSIVHGANAEVIWCDQKGHESLSVCQYATNLNLRPVAGDWVSLRDTYIVAVLDRRNALRRPDPNLRDVQILAANLDLVLLVVPIDRGLNVRMLERFAVMGFDSGARPIVVLTKADESDDASALELETELTVPGVDIIITSSRSGEGLERLRALLHEGITTVMLGASGAGKTSLLNALEGREETTLSVSSTGEGRHATTTRKLYRLSSGGVLLDIPGIRLVDLVSGQEGVDETFADIAEMALGCRFRDCSHNGDEGCAVEAAVESGELPASRLENWRLIQSQMARQSQRRDFATQATKRRRRK